jgi:hypothetical protein
MCDQNVGVARTIDVEAISKDIAQLIKTLDEEVAHGGKEIKVSVKDVKSAAEKLEKLVK